MGQAIVSISLLMCAVGNFFIAFVTFVPRDVQASISVIIRIPTPHEVGIFYLNLKISSFSIPTTIGIFAV